MELPNLPLITLKTSIRDTMFVIDSHAKGIAVVVDEERRLLATITDGDIRRALLAGLEVDQPSVVLIPWYPNPGAKAPITAQIGTSDAVLLTLMQAHSVRQIPLLDLDGRVCEIATLHDLLQQFDLPVTGVIMAGGFGKRLMPLTDGTPKPMLPVNGRPLMEHMLSKLRLAGIRSVSIATHYMKDNIIQHFKDGSEFGVKLNYIEETEPLGTAGSLSKLCTETAPLLVLNGDILTGMDFRAMLDFHRENDAQLTVGVRRYGIEVPFGIVETEGVHVTSIVEKPVLRYLINAGIYMVDPAVCKLVPLNQRFDMPDLIEAVIESGMRVISFPVREYWLDIGRIEQYQRANADVAEGIV
jgi:dTDP-glucose pyrophosphorylase/CBS domain-containing protein